MGGIFLVLAGREHYRGSSILRIIEEGDSVERYLCFPVHSLNRWKHIAYIYYNIILGKIEPRLRLLHFPSRSVPLSVPAAEGKKGRSIRLGSRGNVDNDKIFRNAGR